MAASALSALTTPSILSAGRESESGWNQVLSGISDEPGARPFERAHLIHAEAVPVRCGAQSLHTEAPRRSRASRNPHPTASGIRWERSPVAIGYPIHESRTAIHSFSVKLSSYCLHYVQ